MDLRNGEKERSHVKNLIGRRASGTIPARKVQYLDYVIIAEALQFINYPFVGLPLAAPGGSCRV